MRRKSCDRAHLRGGQFVQQIFKSERRNLRRIVGRGQLGQQKRVADHELRTHIRGHPRHKLSRSEGIERHRQNAAQHAAVKCGDPFCTVFRPDQNALALGDAPRRKQRGKAAGKPCQLPIRRHAPAIALVAHHGNLAVKAAKIVDQRGKVIAHICPGKFMVAAAG